MPSYLTGTRNLGQGLCTAAGIRLPLGHSGAWRECLAKPVSFRISSLEPSRQELVYQVGSVVGSVVGVPPMTASSISHGSGTVGVPPVSCDVYLTGACVRLVHQLVLGNMESTVSGQSPDYC